MELTTHALSRIFPTEKKEETMFDRIKRMDESEMNSFLRFVYENAERDGYDGIGDHDYMTKLLAKSSREIMPNDTVEDLWITKTLPLGTEYTTAKLLYEMLETKEEEDDN